MKTFNPSSNTKSDINIKLEPKPVPEPASVAGLLMLGAVGVSALKRKAQDASEVEV